MKEINKKNEMMELIEKNEMMELIEKNEMAIIYFSGTSCGACDVIKGKVEEILEEYPKVKAGEINGVINKKLAAEYSIFSLPILLLFVEGKETIRLGRNFDMLHFNNIIERYYGMIFF